MTDEWVDVKGFEGIYQVSCNGFVRSLNRLTTDSIGRDKFYEGKIIKPFINGSGYLQVRLYKNGKKYQPYLHKLVAEHFIENPKGHPEVNHINHNKLDCFISNLEWCTRKENMVKMAEFYGIKKEDNYCVDCNKTIRSTSRRCKECESTTRLSAPPVSKDELLDLISNNSFLKVGRMYGVSDNAIRKWCKKYEIPYRRKDLNAK